MPSLYVKTIIGHVGQDPIARYTQSSSCVVSFSVATNFYVPNGKPVAEWHSVKAWGKQAEFLKDNLKKGDAVFVTGHVDLEQWEDKKGEHQVRHVINASEVKILTPKNKESDYQKTDFEKQASIPQSDADENNPF